MMACGRVSPDTTMPAVPCRAFLCYTVPGHGYLSAVLPPPADILRDMADQVTGSSQLLEAGRELTQQMLLVVPLLLGACTHLSPEMPLQQYWAAVSASLWALVWVEAKGSCALVSGCQRQAVTSVPSAAVLFSSPTLAFWEKWYRIHSSCAIGHGFVDLTLRTHQSLVPLRCCVGRLFTHCPFACICCCCFGASAAGAAWWWHAPGCRHCQLHHILLLGAAADAGVGRAKRLCTAAGMAPCLCGCLYSANLMVLYLNALQRVWHSTLNVPP